MSNPIFYVYIYLNPLKPGHYTYDDFISFPFEPFYVGKGNGDRMYEHLKDSSKLKNNKNHKCNKHFCYTILKIQKNGLEPIVIKLSFNLKECKSNALEKNFIKIIGRDDLNLGPLTNHTDGGEGGLTWSNKIQFKDLKFDSFVKLKKYILQNYIIKWPLGYAKKYITRFNDKFTIKQLNGNFIITTYLTLKEFIEIVEQNQKYQKENNPAKRSEVRKKNSLAIKQKHKDGHYDFRKGSKNPWYLNTSAETMEIRNKKISESKKKPIKINGIVYPSITDAIQMTGLSYDVIYNRLKRGVFEYVLF